MGIRNSKITRRRVLLSSAIGLGISTSGCNSDQSSASLEESLDLSANTDPQGRDVYSGEVATINAVVENSSEKEFTEEITLEVNDNIKDSREVTIPSRGKKASL